MIVKVLRFSLRKKTILPAIFFLIGIFMSSFFLENIYLNKQQKIGEIKYDQFYDIELVPNKPEEELIVYPDHASIYNRQGEKFGELMNTPLVYCSNTREI